MGVAVGIFFLGIIGAEIRWGVILPPPLGHTKVAKNLVPAKVKELLPKLTFIVYNCISLLHRQASVHTYGLNSSPILWIHNFIRRRGADQFRRL